MARSKEFEWITSAQAAAILHITDRQIRRLGAGGKIKTMQLNPRMTLFLKSDVERYTARHYEKKAERKAEEHAA